MNFGLGAPWMMWGAALVAVPVLIHLINRRRYVVQPFAAMRFLRQAYESRRRRLRAESLLLLLLRCLVVLLAVLAMALPFVQSDSPLASLVSGGRRELVLLVDRSGSMGRVVSPGVTLDDRTLELVRRRLRELSDDRGDAVTIVFLGRGALLATPIGALPSVALAALEGGLSAPGGVADIVAGARFLGERIAPVRPGRLDVEVFTDLQAESWGAVGSSLGDLFGQVLDERGGQLRIRPVGGELDEVRNLGVESLQAEDALLLAGEPLTFTALVRNHAATSRGVVTGSFFLDDELVERTTVDVPPGGTASVPLRLRIDDVGAHHVSFALDRDELPFDDARTLALEVRPAVEVLLVDGAPAGSNPLSGATGYLGLALDPVETSGTPRFRTELYEVASFEQAANDVARFDLAVLANVGGLTRAAASALADAVRSGTPLLVFTGDRVDPALYAERLEPLGLLPARVGPVQGDPGGVSGEDYVNLVLPDPAPPMLALFADPRLAVLLQVPVFAWNELTPLPDATVLASFADAIGGTRPAIVSSRLGRGTVVLVGTSADASWTLMPRYPATWVPFVHELVAHLAAADPAVANVPVGQTPTLTVEGVPVSAQLVGPSGGVEHIERPDHERVGSRSVLVLDGSPLDEPGAYQLDVTTAEGVQTIALAALPEAREGDLTRVDSASLDAALGGLPYVLGAEQEDPLSESADAGDGSLAMALLWALLVLAVGESIMARWMGMSR